jgi:hypothetical protein
LEINGFECVFALCLPLIIQTNHFPLPGKFDKDASRYHQGVYSRKRLDLTKAIDSALSPLFMGQLKNLHKRCVAKFRTDLLDGLKGEGHDFGALVMEVGARVEKEFKEGAEGKYLACLLAPRLPVSPYRDPAQRH